MGYDIGFIGTGADPDDPDQDGFAMAYRHASGYEALDDCRLTACADIVRENAERFAAEYGIEHVYEQYERMLAETQPDVVSVCVPPGLHADIVVGCAETGVPDAIHCEKPMAKTWGDCREMVRTCEENGIQLSFNHQKRFGGPMREAKRLLDDGAIGTLERLEFSAEHLYDMGTHLFDVCSFMTDDEAVEWVMGQVDYREENVWFGAHNENHGLATWAYEDGTRGLAMTGEGSDYVDCYLRLRGSEGCIEVGPDDGPPLRLRRGSGWKTVDTNREGVHGTSPSRLGRVRNRLVDRLPFLAGDDGPSATYTERAVAEVVAALDAGRPPEIGGRAALRSTEIIFATWESARRRARIDLPLGVDDNPLESMVEAGELTPRAVE
ncbi:Gfo/Idh/MocA family protein [Haloarcula onubensis]|uniref:Gfo/Idh/MocA family oxidoreductase n=1 Tax=Haloarcula onubensis TaxID=2950539 RepID=A0ABU2FLJ1_9EURY|nr:Gfo/Idh/MocA family oxidoreductase [Halomicroarcula sp. S3CR25-11]MDS0281600.1 Gfo/Idh/MocA family oxidoreductase [Halomicroarcula sp. S3CR25-11]